MKYEYTVGDTANTLVDVDALRVQIHASAVPYAVDPENDIQVGGTQSTSTLDVWLKGELDTAGEAALAAVVAAHDGEPLPGVKAEIDLAKQQVDGVPVFALRPPLGRELIDCTGNLADKTTWWTTSERVVDQALTPGADDWWESGDVWIDMTHGKVFDEVALRADAAHGYHVIVTVDSVEQTQREPWASSGGDYEVDYRDGKCRPFTTDAWDGKTVLASYSKMVDSSWRLKPDENYAIVINKAEVQFASDLEYNSGVDMEVWGLADYFAPDMVPDSIPSGTLIKIESTRYDTIDQFIDEAVGAFPPIPAIGGAARGTSVERYVFHFYYGTARQLFSSLGMEVRVRIVDDIEFGGERCTATFYCQVKADPGPMAALAELGLV